MEGLPVSRGLLAVVIVLHLLPLATRPALIGGDEPHYALAAHSLATDFDVQLDDEYAAVTEGASFAGRKRAGERLDSHVIEVGGRQVFAHPIGLPLLVTPLLAMQLRVAPGAAPDLLLLLLTFSVTLAALLAAWRLGIERWGVRLGTALVLGGYFSSPLWYYSRTFFTEPYTWAFAVLAVASLAHRKVLAAAVFLGLTLAMKETSLLLVAPILLVTWRLRGLRTAALASLGPAAFGVFFVAKNLLITGRPLATFQPFQVGDPVAGAFGLLTDPTRGLLYFAPLLLVGLLGLVLVPKDPAERWLFAGAALALLGYFAITATWVDWKGGASYACRLLVPALPALCLPLAHLARAIPAHWMHWLVGTLASLGFAVNLCAAVEPVPAMWNASVLDLAKDQTAAFVAGLLLGATATWAWFFRATGINAGSPREASR